MSFFFIKRYHGFGDVGLLGFKIAKLKSKVLTFRVLDNPVLLLIGVGVHWSLQKLIKASSLTW